MIEGVDNRLDHRPALQVDIQDKWSIGGDQGPFGHIGQNLLDQRPASIRVVSQVLQVRGELAQSRARE